MGCCCDGPATGMFEKQQLGGGTGRSDTGEVLEERSR